MVIESSISHTALSALIVSQIEVEQKSFDERDSCQ